MKKNKYLAFVVWFVSLTLILTSLEPSSFANIHLPSISVPSKLGRVEAVHSKKGSSPRAYLILDAHSSIEAQENIAALIHHLVDKEKATLVLEEGYEGKVPTEEYFAAFEDKKTRKKIADLLVDQLRMGGAEYAHVMREKDFDLWGMDSTEGQRLNLLAAQKLSKYSASINQDLNQIETAIKSVVNSKIPEFAKEIINNKFKGFDLGVMPRKYLTKLAETHGNISSESEFGKLFPILNGDAKKESANNIQIKTFTAELVQAEKEVLKKLVEDPLVLKLVYDLLEVIQYQRLADLQISFEEYAALKESFSSSNKFTQKVAGHLSEASKKSVVLGRGWEWAILYAITFYEAALLRDESFKRMIHETADALGSKWVMVSGGFHRAAIESALKEKSVDYAVIMPRIGSISARHEKLYHERLSEPYYPFERRFFNSVNNSARLQSFTQMASIARNKTNESPSRIMAKYLGAMTSEGSQSSRALTPVSSSRSESRVLNENDLSDLLKAGKRSLLFSDEVNEIDDAISSQAKEESRPYVRVTVKTQQDIDRLLSQMKIVESGEDKPLPGALRLALEGKGVLVIDYAGSDAKIAEGFNSLFDRKPYWREFTGLENLTIVGVVRDAHFEKYPNSFYSRFVTKANFRFNQRPIDPIEGRVVLDAPQEAEDAIEIDLMFHPEFESTLIERFEMNDGIVSVKEGALVDAIRSGKPLYLRRADMSDDSALMVFLRKAFRDEEIVFNGEAIAVPDSFKIYLSQEPSQETVEKINSKKIINPGESESEAPLWVIHDQNAQMLFSRGSVNQEGFAEKPGLIHEKVRVRVVSPLQQFMWHALMASDAITEIEVAPWVKVPTQYATLREKIIAASSEKKSWNDAKKEIEGSKSMLIETNDNDYAQKQIEQAMPNKEIIVFDVAEETTDDVLLGESVTLGERSYSFQVSDVLKALKDGKAVILKNAHARSGVLKELSSALLKDPYVVANGEKETWDGFLAVTTEPSKESEQASLSRVELNYGKEQIEGDIKSALDELGVSRDVQESHIKSIVDFFEIARNIPSPAKAGKKSQTYPDSFEITSSRLKLILQAYAKTKSWVQAVDLVVIGEYSQDLEVQAYLRTMMRLAFNEGFSGQENSQINGRKLRTILNKSTEPIVWEGDYYWEAADTMSLDLLIASGFKLAPIKEKNAGKNFKAIKEALIQKHEKDPREKAAYKHRFKMKIEDWEYSSEVDASWDTPDEITDYEHQIEKAKLALDLNGAVFLKGSPGTGKTYSSKELAQHLGFDWQTQVHQLTVGPDVGEEEIVGRYADEGENFINGPVGNWAEKGGLLFVDEANLQGPHFWNFLSGFFAEDSHVWIRGKRIPVNQNGLKHKIIFTGNQEFLQNRNFIELIRQNMATVTFKSFSDSELFNILSPKVESVKNSEELISMAIELQRMFSRAVEEDTFSLRDLQEILERTKAEAKKNNNEWSKKRLVSLAWKIYSGQIDEVSIIALKNQIAADYGVQAFELDQSLDPEVDEIEFENFVMTKSSRELLDIAHGFVKSLQRRAQSAAQGEEITIDGKNGMIWEGASARAKDDLILRLLEHLGFSSDPGTPSGKRFYRITATPTNAQEVADMVEQARQEGSIVIISEMNLLPSGFLEGKLNDLLTGSASPGFGVIGTMNSTDFSGREALSSALMNRVIYKQVNPYTQNELQQIASNGEAEKSSLGKKLTNLADFHAWLREQIEDGSRHPTVRDLINASQLIRSGRSVEESVREIYGIIFFDKILQRVPESSEWTNFEEKPLVDHALALVKTAQLLLPEELGVPEINITSGSGNAGSRMSSANAIHLDSSQLSNPLPVLYHEISHGLYTVEHRSWGIIEDIWQDLEDLRHPRTFDYFHPFAATSKPSSTETEIYEILSEANPDKQLVALTEFIRRNRPTERALFQWMLAYYANQARYLNESDKEALRNKLESFSSRVQNWMDTKKLRGFKNNPFVSVLPFLEMADQFASQISKSKDREAIFLASHYSSEILDESKSALEEAFGSLSDSPMLPPVIRPKEIKEPKLKEESAEKGNASAKAIEKLRAGEFVNEGEVRGAATYKEEFTADEEVQQLETLLDEIEVDIKKKQPDRIQEISRQLDEALAPDLKPEGWAYGYLQGIQMAGDSRTEALEKRIQQLKKKADKALQPFFLARLFSPVTTWIKTHPRIVTGVVLLMTLAGSVLLLWTQTDFSLGSSMLPEASESFGGAESEAIPKTGDPFDLRRLYDRFLENIQFEKINLKDILTNFAFSLGMVTALIGALALVKKPLVKVEIAARKALISYEKILKPVFYGAGVVGIGYGVISLGAVFLVYAGLFYLGYQALKWSGLLSLLSYEVDEDNFEFAEDESSRRYKYDKNLGDHGVHGDADGEKKVEDAPPISITPKAPEKKALEINKNKIYQPQVDLSQYTHEIEGEIEKAISDFTSVVTDIERVAASQGSLDLDLLIRNGWNLKKARKKLGGIESESKREIVLYATEAFEMNPIMYEFLNSIFERGFKVTIYESETSFIEGLESVDEISSLLSQTKPISPSVVKKNLLEQGKMSALPLSLSGLQERIEFEYLKKSWKGALNAGVIGESTKVDLTKLEEVKVKAAPAPPQSLDDQIEIIEYFAAKNDLEVTHTLFESGKIGIVIKRSKDQKDFGDRDIDLSLLQLVPDLEDITLGEIHGLGNYQLVGLPLNSVTYFTVDDDLSGSLLGDWLGVMPNLSDFSMNVDRAGSWMNSQIVAENLASVRIIDISTQNDFIQIKGWLQNLISTHPHGDELNVRLNHMRSGDSYNREPGAIPLEEESDEAGDNEVNISTFTLNGQIEVINKFEKDHPHLQVFVEIIEGQKLSVTVNKKEEYLDTSLSVDFTLLQGLEDLWSLAVSNVGDFQPQISSFPHLKVLRLNGENIVPSEIRKWTSNTPNIKTLGINSKKLDSMAIDRGGISELHFLESIEVAANDGFVDLKESLLNIEASHPNQGHLAIRLTDNLATSKSGEVYYYRDPSNPFQIDRQGEAADSADERVTAIINRLKSYTDVKDILPPLDKVVGNLNGKVYVALHDLKLNPQIWKLLIGELEGADIVNFSFSNVENLHGLPSSVKELYLGGISTINDWRFLRRLISLEKLDANNATLVDWDYQYLPSSIKEVVGPKLDAFEPVGENQASGFKLNKEPGLWRVKDSVKSNVSEVQVPTLADELEKLDIAKEAEDGWGTRTPIEWNQRAQVENGQLRVDFSRIHFPPKVWSKIIGLLNKYEVNSIDLSSTNITDISNLPASIKQLYLRQAKNIKAWGDWPRLSSLEILDLSNTDITDISQLPASLVSLSLIQSKNIKKWGDWARFNNLEKLGLGGETPIKDISELPASLQELYLTHASKITKWGDWSRFKNLKKLGLMKTSISDISKLPATLTDLDMMFVETVENPSDLARLTNLKNLTLGPEHSFADVFEESSESEGFKIAGKGFDSSSYYQVRKVKTEGVIGSMLTPTQKLEVTRSRLGEVMKEILTAQGRPVENVVYPRGGLLMVDLQGLDLIQAKWREIFQELEFADEVVLDRSNVSAESLEYLPRTLKGLHLGDIGISDFSGLKRFIELQSLSLLGTSIEQLQLPDSLEEIKVDGKNRKLFEIELMGVSKTFKIFGLEGRWRLRNADAPKEAGTYAPDIAVQLTRNKLRALVWSVIDGGTDIGKRVYVRQNGSIHVDLSNINVNDLGDGLSNAWGVVFEALNFADSVDLSSTNITSEGLSLLAEDIEELSLNHISLSDWSVLKRFQNLVKLNVDQANISREGILALPVSLKEFNPSTSEHNDLLEMLPDGVWGGFIINGSDYRYKVKAPVRENDSENLKKDKVTQMDRMTLWRELDRFTDLVGDRIEITLNEKLDDFWSFEIKSSSYATADDNQAVLDLLKNISSSDRIKHLRVENVSMLQTALPKMKHVEILEVIPEYDFHEDNLLKMPNLRRFNVDIPLDQHVNYTQWQKSLAHLAQNHRNSDLITGLDDTHMWDKTGKVWDPDYARGMAWGAGSERIPSHPMDTEVKGSLSSLGKIQSFLKQHRNRDFLVYEDAKTGTRYTTSKLVKTREGIKVRYIDLEEGTIEGQKIKVTEQQLMTMTAAKKKRIEDFAKQRGWTVNIVEVSRDYWFADFDSKELDQESFDINGLDRIPELKKVRFSESIAPKEIYGGIIESVSSLDYRGTSEGPIDEWMRQFPNLKHVSVELTDDIISDKKHLLPLDNPSLETVEVVSDAYPVQDVLFAFADKHPNAEKLKIYHNDVPIIRGKKSTLSMSIDVQASNAESYTGGSSFPYKSSITMSFSTEKLSKEKVKRLSEYGNVTILWEIRRVDWDDVTSHWKEWLQLTEVRTIDAKGLEAFLDSHYLKRIKIDQNFADVNREDVDWFLHNHSNYENLVIEFKDREYTLSRRLKAVMDLDEIEAIPVKKEDVLVGSAVDSQKMKRREELAIVARSLVNPMQAYSNLLASVIEDDNEVEVSKLKEWFRQSGIDVRSLPNPQNTARSESRNISQLKLPEMPSYDFDSLRLEGEALFIFDAVSLSARNEFSDAVFNELLAMSKNFNDQIKISISGEIDLADKESQELYNQRIAFLRDHGFEVFEENKSSIPENLLDRAVGFSPRRVNRLASVKVAGRSEFETGSLGVALLFALNPEAPQFALDGDEYIQDRTGRLSAEFSRMLSQMVAVSVSA